MNDDEFQALSASLNRTLDEVGNAAREATSLFGNADEEISDIVTDLRPVIEGLGDTLEAAEATLNAARLQLSGDSEEAYQLQSTLKEVEGAAAALREFFDYLERNPEALIQGKQP